jgi:hypothetical protein
VYCQFLRRLSEQLPELIRVCLNFSAFKNFSKCIYLFSALHSQTPMGQYRFRPRVPVDKYAVQIHPGTSCLRNVLKYVALRMGYTIDAILRGDYCFSRFKEHKSQTGLLKSSQADSVRCDSFTIRLLHWLVEQENGKIT